MAERFRMIASSYLVLIRDGQVLLSRRFRTGYCDGMYSVPAGHVEDGETLTHALVREVAEETGMDISGRTPVLAHTMHRRDQDIRMDFFFTVDADGLVPRNIEPEKCDDLSWFPLSSLPDNTIPYIRAALAAIGEGRHYSEFGWAAGK